jgi:hypothetical protein
MYALGGVEIRGSCRFRDESRNYVQQEGHYKLRVTCQLWGVGRMEDQDSSQTRRLLV